MDLDKIMVQDINKFLVGNRNEKVTVDIGCSYNSYSMGLGDYRKILIDCNETKLQKYSMDMPNSVIINKKITPDNVLPVFLENQIPENFSFLNIDIDGYDLFVLKRLLEKYKPYLICAELNEKIPPPIKFSVLFSEDYSWDGSHFYGFSASCLEDILQNYGYDLVKIEYNNCFLIKSELNTFGNLSIKDAYQLGYVEALDRANTFYYNSNMQYLLENNTVKDKIDFIDDYFKNYKDKYLISRDKDE